MRKNDSIPPQTVRQGDVLLRRTRNAPSAGAQRLFDDGRVILAYGEATGHAHTVIGVDELDGSDPDPVPAMELFEEPDGTRLLVVKRDAVLTHQEHGKIAVAPGSYEVIRQRQYSPASIEYVAD